MEIVKKLFDDIIDAFTIRGDTVIEFFKKI